MRRKVIDLTGQRCSQLVVLGRAGWRGRKAAWLCRCDCGRTSVITGSNLRRGNTRSCNSCGHRRGALRHGHDTRAGKSPEYQSWINLNQRCRNPRNPAYKYYGGRGIKVEFASFENFLAHVGPRPSGHSIDRIDNDGNYCVGNLRWADRKTQANNQRGRIITGE